MLYRNTYIYNDKDIAMNYSVEETSKQIFLCDEIEAAKFLRIGKHTLRRWRSLGKPPRYTKIGGAVRYDRQDLIDFIKDGQRPLTDERLDGGQP